MLVSFVASNWVLEAFGRLLIDSKLELCCRLTNYYSVFIYSLSVTSIRVLAELKKLISEVRLFLLRLLCFQSIPVVIVTAADYSHEKSLLNFIDSLSRFHGGVKVSIYDLGMSKVALERLSEKGKFFSHFEIKTFTFAKLPDWMSLASRNKGGYAWKPLIIQNEICEVMSEGTAQPCLIYSDAGNLIIRNLKFLAFLVSKFGFFSTASKGKVANWTVLSTRRILDPSDDYAECQNINAALLGFNLGNTKVMNLVRVWSMHAQSELVISPVESTLENHRFDQSILTLLSYKFDLVPFWIETEVASKRFGFVCHQDID